VEPVNNQIIALVRSGHRCLRIVTTEESDALAEIVSAAMGLKLDVLIWSSVHGVYDGLIEGRDPVPNTENPTAGLYQLARATKPTMHVLLDSCAYLQQDERTLRAWRELVARCELSGSCILMLDHRAEAPGIVEATAHRLEFPLPDEAQLERIVRDTLKRLHKQSPLRAEVTQPELRSIVSNLRGLTRRQTERVIAEAVIHDRVLSIADLPGIMDAKRALIQSEGLLEHQPAPETLDQIGGMSRIKIWLSKRADLFNSSADDATIPPPRGILLLGVQGGGKSLCAKAVATAFRRPLLRLDVGALYDRYIGESERRLRSALKQAERMSPIVLWIDEIEKAFAGAASQSSDGGLSRRMFGSLLTWMQEHRHPVFLVATANDIEALPPELLRKGRFDEIFFVDLPGDEARRAIFRIHLSKRKLEPRKFDLEALSEAAKGFSGAEIEQAIISAMLDARSSGEPLVTNHIVDALKCSPPLSVTMREKVDDLRAWAVDRCVPADAEPAT
jgi:SpoVK/Ycf46/Vps4 family AAA+-type ATPase